jgi:hypothetical protein
MFFFKHQCVSGDELSRLHMSRKFMKNRTLQVPKYLDRAQKLQLTSLEGVPHQDNSATQVSNHPPDYQGINRSAVLSSVVQEEVLSILLNTDTVQSNTTSPKTRPSRTT